MTIDLPTLDAVLIDPGKAVALPRETLYTLWLSALQVEKILVLQLATPPASVESMAPERWLTVEEVADRFGVTKTWLYRHKRKLPHSQPSRKTLLFPEKALTRWFANR
jgi:excisionase family DNA binding protein